MNKITERIPFVLLLLLIPVNYYLGHNIFNTSIVLSLLCLCGYQHFIELNKSPDYTEEFKTKLDDIEVKYKKQIEDRDKKYSAALIHLEKKVNDLNANYGVFQ